LSPRAGRLALAASATLGLALAFAPAAARACDSSSCALVTRGQNGLVPKGGLRLDLSYRHTDDGVGLEGSRATDRVYRPKVALELGRIWPAFHRERGGHERFLQLDVGYGLGTRTTLLASVPLFADRSYRIAHGAFEEDYGTTGFGDVLLGVRRALGGGGLVAGFSVKLPTAPYREGGDFDGTILDPMLQRGSGSWDLVSTAQYSGRIASWLVDWSLVGSYQVNTGNSLGYRFGNLTVLAAGAGRTVAGPVGATLQLKFVHEARHHFRGEAVPSTGSRLWYLTPGLRVRLPGRSSAYGLVQLLPHRHVNDTQLAPRAAVLAGVSKTF